MYFRSRRQLRAGDHQYRHAERTRGVELGAGSVAARVLADDAFDALAAQQGDFIVEAEWAAREQQGVIRQRQRFCGRIDQAQQIMVLGLIGKQRCLQAADGEQHALRGPGERRHGGRKIGHFLPAIAGLCLPGWPAECEQRRAGANCRSVGIATHARSKRMGGIDEVADVLCAQIGDQTVDAAKAAVAGRQRLGTRLFDPASVAEHRVDAALGKGARQGAGFGAAAEQQDFRGGNGCSNRGSNRDRRGRG